MSRYALAVLPAARRDLKGLDPLTLRIVDSAILGLAVEPRPFGSKKLQGESVYRIRISTMHGPHRILYAIDDTSRTVTIARVVHRKDAY